jgi:tRNA threonylcarbamoyladenosine biosynthesis protein TsaB
MIILTLRTDKPEAEIGLYDGSTKLKGKTWAAHRKLAETLHAEILELLEAAGYSWVNIQGIVCYKGPGSFTGLRIGLSVGNALASSLTAPIVSQGGKSWEENGIKRLILGEDYKTALPEYGGEIFITAPRK